jgi:rRNA maturation protein Nop10
MFGSTGKYKGKKKRAMFYTFPYEACQRCGYPTEIKLL